MILLILILYTNTNIRIVFNVVPVRFCNSVQIYYIMNVCYSKI